jgi:hypothetical protein
LALHRKNSVCCLVARSLAHGNGGHGRTGIDDLVSLEALLDVLVEPFGETGIALSIESEQVFRGLFLDNTTIEILAERERNA